MSIVIHYFILLLLNQIFEEQRTVLENELVALELVASKQKGKITFFCSPGAEVLGRIEMLFIELCKAVVLGWEFFQVEGTKDKLCHF